VPPAYFLGGSLTAAQVGLEGQLQTSGLAPSKQLISALRDRRFLAFMHKCSSLSVGKMNELTRALF
jgi:hypothetical protein